MLRKLLISDFRVVKELELALGEGLNIITGETGAGKSILVGALEAALGQEVDRDDVRQPAKCATVVAEFELGPDSAATERIMELLPDQDAKLVLERRIFVGGRSSCRVNGRQVSRELLLELGQWLVDIHGQHEHQLLLTDASQLEILDDFAELRSVRGELTQLYRRWHELRRLAHECKDRLENARRLENERAFQLAELKSASIQYGERIELERELKLLSTGHNYKDVCQAARMDLVEDDEAVAARLARVIRDLDGVGEHFPELMRGLKALEGSLVEVQEVADIVRAVEKNLEINPAREQEVEERLSLLIGLEKKYGRDEAGLINLRDELEEQSRSAERVRDELATLETDLEQVRTSLEETATLLSKGRGRAAEQLSPRLEEELTQLGMDRSRILARLEPVGVRDGFAGDAKGKERVKFLFSSATGEEPRELSKVASGGELSRIMLALKTVLGNSDPVTTMVFDEIDSGVGGGLARVIGERLRRLRNAKQLICITHLAPIASRADQHFCVEKGEDDRVSITIRELDAGGRIAEIARMLGGFPLTEEAKQHAEALLSEGSD